MRRSAPTLLVLLLAASVSACGTSDNLGPDLALTPTEQFAIEVRQQQDQIQLAARSGVLSSNQVQALAALAGRWRENAGAAVVIETPAGAQNAATGLATATAAARVLADYGVPATAIVSMSYAAAGAADGVVRVGYSHQVAQGPNCAAHQSDFSATFENRPVSGFGCANVANLAAQIAYPSDLLAQKAADPADAARRGVVTDTYRAGRPTGTPRSSNPSESARVEEASQ